MKIHAEFVAPSQLGGRVWDWRISPEQIDLDIDRTVFGYLSEDAAAARPIVTFMAAYALEAEYRQGNAIVIQWLDGRGMTQLAIDWAADPKGMAPRLLRLLLKATRTSTGPPPPQRPQLRLVH